VQINSLSGYSKKWGIDLFVAFGVRFWPSTNGAIPFSKPANLLTRQNKNQPEREFLENGKNPENKPEREILENAENPEIRKIRNNNKNAQTRITQRSRQKKRKSEKQKREPNQATGLRLEIQKLKDTIATRKKENPHNPELLFLNKLCNQKKN